MKREILCPGCCREGVLGVGASHIGDSFTSTTKYAGEFIRVVMGRSKQDCLCDRCGVGIKVGVECAAFSIFTEAAPFFAWEHDFVTTPSDQGVMELEFILEKWEKGVKNGM